MNIILLGAPGAGKGTQAKRIAGQYSIPHISVGDIFRANIKANTELGQKAKTYIDQGALVPDDITCDIVTKRIAEKDCENGFVLDGFPRTIIQADALAEALDAMQQQVDAAIDVEVPDETIINRMSGRRVCPKCGASYHIEFNPTKQENICDACGNETVQREDDKEETVLKRLNIYHERTQPLIDYYRKREKLKVIDGTQPMDDVFENIVRLLGEV